MEPEQIHLSRFSKGNKESFAYLYKQWSGKVYNFVLRLSGGDTYLAEEIVQSVFVKVWEKRGDIDPEKSFSAYLFAISRNLLTNIYQHKMQEYLYREQVVTPASYQDTYTEKEVEFHLLEEYINSLIKELPPARREIYMLSRQKLPTNKEIASRLNISEHTVESQLTKALHFLRNKIKQHYNLALLLLLYCLNN